MRYADILNCEVANGEGVGVSLFVQGCHFHCYNCFNSDTWDFNGGKEWTTETKNKLFELLDHSYIKRFSILGGEPLSDENTESVLKIVKEVRADFPEKRIWLYSGFTWNSIMYPVTTQDFNPERDRMIRTRREILQQTDILVDGKYMEELKDYTLNFRGSSNQRIIDVKKSLQNKSVVLYDPQTE